MFDVNHLSRKVYTLEKLLFPLDELKYLSQIYIHI